MRNAEQIITKHALDTLQTRLPSNSVSLSPLQPKYLHCLSLCHSLFLSLSLSLYLFRSPGCPFYFGSPPCLLCVFMLNKLAVLTESKIVSNRPKSRLVDTP